jgi:hypothetical protein
VRWCGALLLAACASTPFPAHEPVTDERARSALVERLVPEPAAATVVQRWILERGGSEFFFTLYLRVAPPNSLRIAALSDLGGTLAEAASTAGAVEVIRESRFLRGRLVAALLRDLEPLFLPAGRDRYRAVRVDGGGLALHLRRFGQEALFLDGPDGGTRIHLGANGRTRTVATVDAWRRAGGRLLGPASLRLASPEAGYAATIEVVSWEKE